MKLFETQDHPQNRLFHYQKIKANNHQLEQQYINEQYDNHNHNHNYDVYDDIQLDEMDDFKTSRPMYSVNPTYQSPSKSYIHSQQPPTLYPRQQIEKNISQQRQLFNAVSISFIVGLYDGFIGPGTGSLLIMAFVAILGFDFLQASTNAKLVNLATNIGSITLFVIKGKIVWAIAIPMAVCNATGAFIGARLAISKGNGFIRVFFLVIVAITLLRFGYDVFIK
mgnify:CR=1 FL=1